LEWQDDNEISLSKKLQNGMDNLPFSELPAAVELTERNIRLSRNIAMFHGRLLGDIRASYLVAQLQKHALIFPLKEEEVSSEEQASDLFEHRYYSYRVSDTHYVIGNHLLEDTTGFEE
jgi:hypothetical protein